MLEVAEVGNTLSREEYERAIPDLRRSLIRLQREVEELGAAVLIIIGGVEGAGKGETVKLLTEWLDTHGIETSAFDTPSDEERERPRFWRYWRALAPRGKIGIFFGSWYSEPITDRAFGRTRRAQLDSELDRIQALEQMLSAEGTLVLKLWMHLSANAQRARMRSLRADPRTRWKVTEQEREYFKRYDRFRRASERVLRKTSSGHAPWHVIEATDPHYRGLTVGRLLEKALADHVRRTRERAAAHVEREPPPVPPALNVINRLDQTLAVTQKAYDAELLVLQGRLNRLARRMYEQRRSMIVVLEGPDAAGKGGAIRRLTAAMDARLYRVISVAAPTDEERLHPYLWRFWRQLPRQGRVTIYDRSWYGRVLVERVEGFCAPDDWRRGYLEINEFEEELGLHGSVLVKLWLAVTADEQLRRFQAREEIPYKQYKITEDDWRNREKWSAYEAAACEMIERTSTELAPWTLVEANDKHWARLKVLRSVGDRLEQALGKKR